MNEIALWIAGRPAAWAEAAPALAASVLVSLLIVTALLLRGRRDRAMEAAAAEERARDMDDKVAELVRIQTEMTGRMQTIAEVFGSRQSDFARLLAERLDGLQHRVGQGLESSTRQQTETLSKLNERLAVIDAAQKNLTNLTGEVAGLKEVLANKQARGAYGQGRMEAIIRDGLPCGSYAFQATLSNRTRPDCVVRLPGDARGLVVDAKFPLEAFTGFRAAKDAEARRKAAGRVRNDVLLHVKDLAGKYLIPGETQDIALMFVPAESVYADLQEHFDDVVQRAHRARIVIVSPSLLALAIQVLQTLGRDARIREEARVIQAEVSRLVEDVLRLNERVDKLDAHFRQAQEDVAQIKTSTEKIARRGRRIEALEFEEGGSLQAGPMPAGARTLRAVDRGRASAESPAGAGPGGASIG
jgi:DNA recombination protein RmuC